MSPDWTLHANRQPYAKSSQLLTVAIKIHAAIMYNTLYPPNILKVYRLDVAPRNDVLFTCTCNGAADLPLIGGSLLDNPFNSRSGQC